MAKILVPAFGLEIRPVSPDEMEAVLDVYRGCEDFLALGPVATASMDMVLQDMQISKQAGGLFCGIYASDGKMLGVLDYVPGHYRGDPSQAFLELLMIAAPFRSRGIGKAVVEALENEIRRDGRVKAILAGVQVNNPLAVKFWQNNGFRIVSEPHLLPDQTTAVDLIKTWS